MASLLANVKFSTVAQAPDTQARNARSTTVLKMTVMTSSTFLDFKFVLIFLPADVDYTPSILHGYIGFKYKKKRHRSNFRSNYECPLTGDVDAID